jgi:serine/threonine-protein kinase
MSNSTETSRQRDPVPTDSRYECLLKIASGGMATVYVGRLRGRYGFSRLVAIKRAHAHLLDDEQFRRLLIGEARLASRIHHPNVVSDVDEPREELLLVMDYVEGAALSQLLSTCRAASPLPVGVTVRIMIDVCAGLHAAHELVGERGEPLEIVHRDVSPQNVLVGVDGLSRITDFGVAKWTEATQATTNGWKGKFAYMAPEYVRDRAADRRADVFGVGVMLWEALANRRLFRGEDGSATMWLVANHTPEEIGALVPGLPAELAQVVARALEKEPDARYATAKDLADALESAANAAGLDTTAAAVKKAVDDLFGEVLGARRAVLRGLLTDSGESTTEASAIVAGRNADGPVTATGVLTMTMSDARTIPVQRATSSPIADVAADPPAPDALSNEATTAPVLSSAAPASAEPRGNRGRVWIGVAATAVLSAGITWAIAQRGGTSPAVSSLTPSATATTMPLAVSSTLGAAQDPSAAHDKAPKRATPPTPVRRGATSPRAASMPDADSAVEATPATAAAPLPSGKPGRPGLGY